MNKISKEKQTHIALVCIGTLIIAAGLWFGLINSQQRKLSDIQKKTADLQQKVASANAQLKRSDDIETELERNVQSLELIEDSMAPSNDIYGWFLLTMNRFIGSRPVQNFNSGLPALGEVSLLPKFPYKSATFGVRLTGFYHDIGSFVADFENNFPYMRLQNLELTPASGPNVAPQDREKLDFKFEVVTLYQTNRQVTLK